MGRHPKRDYLLKIISASKGMSREMLADAAKVSLHNIWRAEVGQGLSEDAAVKIADCLEISSDIMYYNMGKFPPDKIEFVKKDPLFFKEVMDEICAEPWKLTKTTKYMETIKDKVKEIKTQENKKKQPVNPEINKILSQLKPTE